jgi:hypothetical protein
MAEGAKTASGSRSDGRRRRVAAELRANLVKRKEQARARAAAAPATVVGKDGKPDG